MVCLFTQLPVVDLNSKIRANVLQLDIMPPEEDRLPVFFDTCASGDVLLLWKRMDSCRLRTGMVRRGDCGIMYTKAKR